MALKNYLVMLRNTFALLLVLFFTRDNENHTSKWGGGGRNYRCIFSLTLVNEVSSASHLSNYFDYISSCVCLRLSSLI